MDDEALHSLQRHFPQLSQELQYILITLIATILRRLDVVSYCMEVALRGSHKNEPSSKVDFVLKLKDALLKLSYAYVVISKAIVEWSPKLKDALPTTPSRPKALPDTVIEAGKECINQMYGNHATRIYEIFDSTYGPEVSQHIIQNVYGSLLSFEEYLNLEETKLSIVVALYVMDCRAQLKGHVLGAANMGLDESDLVALFKFVQQPQE
ncbi:hypothetical protein BKA69DRAFT_1122914 [Paraphysoderma sedebokerense]|nr:hypothetical protein BKA69DRAFT_1122914 [Paraphysoderma sedebokerense]